MVIKFKFLMHSRMDDVVPLPRTMWLVFSALQPGSTVTVAAADGRLLQTVSANADGTAIVDLSGQAKGVYVVSTKGGSIKVINK